jgi:hypothetical protein
VCVDIVSSAAIGAATRRSIGITRIFFTF